MNTALQTEFDRLENERRLVMNKKLFTKNEIDDSFIKGLLAGLAVGLVFMYLVCHFS